MAAEQPELLSSLQPCALLSAIYHTINIPQVLLRFFRGSTCKLASYPFVVSISLPTMKSGIFKRRCSMSLQLGSSQCILENRGRLNSTRRANEFLGGILTAPMKHAPESHANDSSIAWQPPRGSREMIIEESHVPESTVYMVSGT